MKIISTSHRFVKRNLFQACIFILAFIRGLSGNTFLSNIDAFKLIESLVQLAIYFITVAIIINKSYSSKFIMGYLLVGIAFLIGYYKSGMSVFLICYFLILASSGEDYLSILEMLFCGLLVAFILSSFLYFLGWAPYISGEYSKKAVTFGYGHPNQAGLILTILFMLWFSIEHIRDKSDRAMIFAIPYALMVMIFTKSKTAFMIIVALPFVIQLTKMIVCHTSKSNCLRYILMVSQPLFYLFTIITAVCFPKSKLVQNIDLLLTNRVFLNWYAFNNNTITSFGHPANFHAEGVYNAVRKTGNIITTVDNSYVVSLIVLGLIPSVICMIAYFITMRKANDNREYVVVGIGTLISLYAIMEAQIIDIYVFFVYFYILSADAKIKASYVNKIDKYNSLIDGEVYDT